jgi:methionine-rich copper-binding protein CopC
MKTPTLRSALSLLPLLAALLFTHNTALAHSALASSLPGDGQTVAAPAALLLDFNGPVSLLKLSVSGSDGEVATGFSAKAEAAAQFEIALPSLADGLYSVDWSILGADGHTVSKSFNFVVDATAAAASSSGAATHNATHNGHHGGAE